MQSLNIYFTGANQVETHVEPVRELQPEEVLLQATRSIISTGTEGICLGRLFDPGTHWDNWIKYPFSPGYSLVGNVIATGSAVTKAKVGDRVAAAVTHKQFNITHQNKLIPIPDGVSDEDATWFHLAYITQVGVRRAEHQLGDSVALIGVGLLGQLVTQYLRLSGARAIIAIDPAEMRLKMAAAHGATTTLAMTAEAAREYVLELTEGEGVNVVYDITGFASVFPSAIRLAGDYGKVIILGDTGSPGKQQLTGDVITKGLRIIGAHDMHAPAVSTARDYWSHKRMAELFFTYLQRGDMRVNDLVTHRYSPADAVETYRMLREERATAMGVIFDWTRL